MRQVSRSFEQKWSIVVGERGEIPALFQTALDALVARATLVRDDVCLVLFSRASPYLRPAIQTATMERA